MLGTCMFANYWGETLLYGKLCTPTLSSSVHSYDSFVQFSSKSCHRMLRHTCCIEAVLASLCKSCIPNVSFSGASHFVTHPYRIGGNQTSPSTLGTGSPYTCQTCIHALNTVGIPALYSLPYEHVRCWPSRSWRQICVCKPSTRGCLLSDILPRVLREQHSTCICENLGQPFADCFAPL